MILDESVEAKKAVEKQMVIATEQLVVEQREIQAALTEKCTQLEGMNTLLHSRIRQMQEWCMLYGRSNIAHEFDYMLHGMLPYILYACCMQCCTHEAGMLACMLYVCRI